MRFLKRTNEQAGNGDISHAEPSTGGTMTGEKSATGAAASPVHQERITLIACFLGLVASVGGFMFGYVRCVPNCILNYMLYSDHFCGN